MPDFLDEKRTEIGARLKELKPFVTEYERLQAAAVALAAVSPAAGTQAPPGGRRTRRATSSELTPRPGAAAAKKGRGRPKGMGARAKEALELVKANPGITIPQIAQRMGIKRNYLYRVLPSLASDGLVERDGGGWRPKTADMRSLS